MKKLSDAVRLYALEARVDEMERDAQMLRALLAEESAARFDAAMQRLNAQRDEDRANELQRKLRDHVTALVQRDQSRAKKARS